MSPTNLHASSIPCAVHMRTFAGFWEGPGGISCQRAAPACETLSATARPDGPAPATISSTLPTLLSNFGSTRSSVLMLLSGTSLCFGPAADALLLDAPLVSFVGLSRACTHWTWIPTALPLLLQYDLPGCPALGNLFTALPSKWGLRASCQLHFIACALTSQRRHPSWTVKPFPSISI